MRAGWAFHRTIPFPSGGYASGVMPAVVPEMCRLIGNDLGTENEGEESEMKCVGWGPS